MTTGFLLMFVGLQFHAIKTYHLTPKASLFVDQRIEATANKDPSDAGLLQQNRFLSASYSNDYPSAINPAASRSPKTITPPHWFKWAALFAGAVLFLQGLATPR